MQLTVYLLKSTVTPSLDALDSPATVRRVPVAIDSIDAELYVKDSRPQAPKWTSFFGGHADLSALSLWSASSSAVLILCVAGRWFAVTFGHGRHLLAQGAWEPNFGLKVTLNSIEDSSIRSIDRRSFDPIGRHTKEQATRPGSIQQFGLHVEEDLLRAVVGKPEDQELGRRLAGMDALSVTTSAPLAELPAALGRYLHQWRQTTYRERYPWVDHVAEVRDRRLVEELDAELAGRLAQRRLEHTWLAVPEAIDWSQVGGFRFTRSGSARVHSDIHLRTLLEGLRSPERLSVSTLKNKRIYCLDSDGRYARHTWSAHQCLYAELRHGDKVFLLTGGQWYQIARSFVLQVDEEVRRLPASRYRLPGYRHVNEADYNRSVADGNDAIALMDLQNIRYGGGASAVEFCDLFIEGRAFLHVKRYGGSSALSHLFSQGLVSATLFAQDPDFRRRVRERLSPVHRGGVPEEHPRLDGYEVGFAIISRSKGELALPFFSKVNLRNAARSLRGLGYGVSLTKVDVEE